MIVLGGETSRKANIKTEFILNYLVFYVTFYSQGDIATGSLQVEETNAYCTVKHRALASNYHLSNMKRLAPRFEPAASEVGGENQPLHHQAP